MSDVIPAYEADERASTSDVTNPYFESPTVKFIITDRGSQLVELQDDWRVTLDMHSYLLIPKGTRSNFATIPWFLRWAVSPCDPVILLPSIIHDHLVSEWAGDVPIRYIPIDDGESDPYIKAEPLFPNGHDWVASAKLFRKYALSFRGRTAHVKARVCYVMIRLFGFYRDLVTWLTK